MHNYGAQNVAGETMLATEHANGLDTSIALLPSATQITTKAAKNRELSWQLVSNHICLFWRMTSPYFQESTHSRWLLASLLLLTFATSGVAVVVSFLNKHFYNALNSKDSKEFYIVLGKYVVAMFLGAPIVALSNYVREQLAVHWREWMTERTFRLYMKNRVYYNLERNGDIDNPDQRISEDINSFTSYSLDLGVAILSALIDLIAFSSILWSIYPLLFGVVFMYAGSGTILTAYWGRSLVDLNFAQLNIEADFRYLLVRLRENCESIAFYAGEDAEGELVGQRMTRVMENRRRINMAERNLEFFSITYGYMVQLIPVAVIAPSYFAGHIMFGAVTQSIGAFNHIVQDLCIVINRFERLSAFSAGVERLSTFYCAILEDDSNCLDEVGPLLALKLGEKSRVEDDQPSSPPALFSTETSFKISMEFFASGQLTDKVILSIHDLELKTPDGNRTLMRNLNLTLHEGKPLVIMGNSGSGKSSLLRAISGLWTLGNGTIRRPVDEEVYFLPQRPYCTLGSLKDQIMYPSLCTSREPDDQTKQSRSWWPTKELSDDDLIEILEKVGLVNVAKRAGDGDTKAGLQATLDWSNMLSLGEQQRLAFARLLANRPRLVLLDEATSALDMDNEERMYSLLNEMSRNNPLCDAPVNYISVGHRPSLLSYHHSRLCLNGDQTFDLTLIGNLGYL